MMESIGRQPEDHRPRGWDNTPPANRPVEMQQSESWRRLVETETFSLRLGASCTKLLCDLAVGIRALLGGDIWTR